MEQSVSLSEGLPRKVRIWRTVAAILLLVGPVRWILYALFYFPDRLLWYQFDGDAEKINHFLIGIMALCQIISWGILILVASNRPTRIAMLLLGVWIVLADTLLFAEWMSWVSSGCMAYVNYLDVFLFVYGYSIILKSNRLSPINKTWIGLLIVLEVCFSVDSFYPFWSGNVDSTEVFGNLSNSIFWGIQRVFLIVCYWKFAHCEAFAGRYDDARMPNRVYDPLNRYVVGFSVSVAIVCGLLWTYFEYAAPWLRELM